MDRPSAEARQSWSTGAVLPARVDEVVVDVSARLGRVCGHLPVAEFDASVRRIAEFKVKYERAG